MARATELLRSGATAGSSYAEVWIRDLATFLEFGLDHGQPEDFREALRTFFLFQLESGSIIDGYTGNEEGIHDYRFIRSPLLPHLKAHKNTVEADQESSLVQAVRIYVEKTGDRAFLHESIEGLTIIRRLGNALEFLLNERWSEAHGLVWNATTIDWGDVQPEHAWGVELDETSHPALGIYTNAMFLIALRDLAWLCDQAGLPSEKWIHLAEVTSTRIIRHLWDESRRKFKPHVYLRGSPFPEDFDEASIYLHGGTAVAIQAGMLSPEEVLHAYHRMRQNQREAGAQTIGLTIWPTYNVPKSPNRVFREPFHYQNGGDWPWFGGRMVLGLIQYDLIPEAYEALVPMVSMIEKAGDFNEWYAPDGTPMGSPAFRGAAGVIGLAMKKLRAWASSTQTVKGRR
jgi:hypothetical protein